jgi:hypothetical protein
LISRFEKVLLIILAGLGAGYWGYGLLLYLSIPGEYKPWFGIEMGAGVVLFFIYEFAIIKNKVMKRSTAWFLFCTVLIVALGLVIFIEDILNIQVGSGS